MPTSIGGWAGGLLRAAIFTLAFLRVAGALPFREALRRRIARDGGVDAIGVLEAARDCAV